MNLGNTDIPPFRPRSVLTAGLEGVFFGAAGSAALFGLRQFFPDDQRWMTNNELLFMLASATALSGALAAWSAHIGNQICGSTYDVLASLHERLGSEEPDGPA